MKTTKNVVKIDVSKIFCDGERKFILEIKRGVSLKSTATSR